MKYLIKWRGFDTEYNLWVSEKKMNCNALKKKYLNNKSYKNEAERLCMIEANFIGNETLQWSETITYKFVKILDQTNNFLSKSKFIKKISNYKFNNTFIFIIIR